jgi:hypothetical protein
MAYDEFFKILDAVNASTDGAKGTARLALESLNSQLGLGLADDQIDNTVPLATAIRTVQGRIAIKRAANEITGPQIDAAIQQVGRDSGTALLANISDTVGDIATSLGWNISGGTNAGATAGQPSGGWIDRFWNQAKSGAREIGQKLTGGQGAGAAVGNVFDVAVKGPLSFLGKAWRKAQTIESPFARSAIVGGVGLVAALLGLKAFQHGGKISAGAGLLVVLAAAVGYGRDAVLPYTPDSPRVVPA